MSADQGPLIPRVTLREQFVAWLWVLPAAMFLWEKSTEEVDGANVKLALAGTASRFNHILETTTVSDVKSTLVRDFFFVAAWLVVAPALLRYARRWVPPYRAEGFWPMLWIAALAAGLLDVIENVLTWITIDAHPPTDTLTLALATVSWCKFLAYLAAIVGVVFLVIGPTWPRWVRRSLRAVFSFIFDRNSPPYAGIAIPPPPSAPESAGSGIGICASGGGIRAASVTLGALRGLDTPTTPAHPTTVFRRARWLHAVSGGAYTATGWFTARRPGAEVPPLPSDAADGLFDEQGAWYQSVEQRERYLDNGHLSLLGGAIGLIVRILFAMATLVSIVFIIGWLTGWLVGWWAIYPHFPNATHGGAALQIGDMFCARFIVPPLALLALGLFLLLLSLARAGAWRSSLRTAAHVPLGVGAFLGVLLVVIPIVLLFGARGARNATELLPTGGTDTANKGTSVLGILSALGIIGALTKVLVSQVQQRALRLGGVLLAVLALLLVGKVASDVAYAHDSYVGARYFDHWWMILAALAWQLVYECVATHRQTLAGMYRKRLAGTFALKPGTTAPLDSVGYREERPWPASAAVDGPELVLCATAHAKGTQIGGLPALGFTFSPRGVVLYDEVERDQPFIGPGQYPHGSWWDGYPRGWVPTRSMAITGAAFASAMGRQSLGTTNALLVAFNIRLGCWIPNPAQANAFAEDPDRAPRVHVGYLVKELFGQYHPKRDPFLYVADGGHRDNLGLVELLRKHPTTVFVIDASGDTPGKFTTLKEAIELAEVELGTVITIDDDEWDQILHPPTGLPKDCVATGTIRYTDGSPGGTLYYGRHQVSIESSEKIRRFAAENPKFPNYSTGNQFLSPAEFKGLVALGQEVGTRLRQRFES